MDEDEVFAAAVKRLREERGWSQAEVSRRMAEAGYRQFHPTTVSRVENGERAVKLSEAWALAAVFSTTVAEMTAQQGAAEFISEMRVRLREMQSCRMRLGEVAEELLILAQETLGVLESIATATWSGDALVERAADEAGREARKSLNVLNAAGFKSSLAADSDDSAS